MLLYNDIFWKSDDSKVVDVYNLNIVLLEFLTSTKPIDSTLPNGMDLVSWVTPLLISEEGLQMIVDDRLRKNYPLVAVKKVIKSHNQLGLCLMHWFKNTMLWSMQITGFVVSCLANQPNGWDFGKSTGSFT